MGLTFLAMTVDDLADVGRIIKDVYKEQFFEDLAVLAKKLQRCPEGCWVCVENGITVGYMFSHPGRFTRPPGLNTTPIDGDGSANDDCYFIHDIAVVQSHRGLGVARRFVGYALAIASKRGLGIVALVSVQGTRGYWQSLGFEPFHGPEETSSYIRTSYGDGACYMFRRIL